MRKTEDAQTSSAHCARRPPIAWHFSDIIGGLSVGMKTVGRKLAGRKLAGRKSRLRCYCRFSDNCRKSYRSEKYIKGGYHILTMQHSLSIPLDKTDECHDWVEMDNILTMFRAKQMTQ